MASSRKVLSQPGTETGRSKENVLISDNLVVCCSSEQSIQIINFNYNSRFYSFLRDAQKFISKRHKGHPVESEEAEHRDEQSTVKDEEI